MLFAPSVLRDQQCTLPHNSPPSSAQFVIFVVHTPRQGSTNAHETSQSLVKSLNRVLFCRLPPIVHQGLCCVLPQPCASEATVAVLIIGLIRESSTRVLSPGSRLSWLGEGLKTFLHDPHLQSLVRNCGSTETGGCPCTTVPAVSMSQPAGPTAQPRRRTRARCSCRCRTTQLAA